MKIGFIGAGNMGSAIIRGFITSGTVSNNDLCFYEPNTAKLEAFAKELNIKGCSGYKELIDFSDTVVLAVKPNIYKPLLGEIKDDLKAKNPLIISIAAGTSTSQVEELLGYNAPIIRIMPNINAQVLHSCTAVCKNESASAAQLEDVIKLFSGIGYAAEVPENQFAIFTGIASCSPAYVYMFINALAEGALKAGMNKKMALQFAAHAVLGSAKMFTNSDKHPMELCDMVCSPGGTTIEGVCTLDEYKFSAGIVKAVENSILKDAQLSKK